MSAPTSVDIHVGNRIRLIRILRGFSQGRLAESLRVTFQQIQKYERGANRVGAGRLYEIAQALGVPVNFFFEDIQSPPADEAGFALCEEMQPLRPPRNGSLQGYNVLDDVKRLTSAETMELVNAYYRVKNIAARKQILVLLKNLAEQEI